MNEVSLTLSFPTLATALAALTLLSEAGAEPSTATTTVRKPRGGATKPTETKTYADGSSVTGVGPLPGQSPAQQDAVDAVPPVATAQSATPVKPEPVAADIDFDPLADVVEPVKPAAPTFEEVHALLAKVGAEKGRAVLLAVMQRTGVKMASEMKDKPATLTNAKSWAEQALAGVDITASQV